MTEPFVIARTFAAPRETVWKAWTEREALNAWFGPKGSEGAIVEHDLRPGGLWRGWMSVPDLGRIHSRFKFVEIVPPERLVWEHSFGDADGNIVRAPIDPNWPLVMLTTVTFEEAGDQTRMTLTWIPLDANEAEMAVFEAAKPGMTEGWSGSFEALDAWLAGR